MTDQVYEAQFERKIEDSYVNYLIDSGATCHDTNNNMDLLDVMSVDRSITAAENSTCHSTKQGSLILKV